MSFKEWFEETYTENPSIKFTKDDLIECWQRAHNESQNKGWAKCAAEVDKILAKHNTTREELLKLK